MRSTIALCLIALFAGAFAADSMATIQESKIASALVGLFQVSTADEFDQVREAIAEARTEVEGILKRTRDQFTQIGDDYSSEVSAIEANIQRISDTLTETDNRLTNELKHADELRTDISESAQAIVEAQNQQDNERARRVEVHNVFRDTYDKVKTAIDDTEDALRLLKELSDQDLEGSFLEISNKKIKAHFNKIHKALVELNIKSSTPMTEMLVELTSEGLNADLIFQITALVNQLLDDLNNQLNSLVKNDNNDDEYSRNALATLQDTIDVETHSAQTNQEELTSLEVDIDRDTKAKSDFASNLETEQENLQAKKAAFSDASDRFTALIKRLLRDLDAIDAAEKFIPREEADE